MLYELKKIVMQLLLQNHGEVLLISGLSGFENTAV